MSFISIYSPTILGLFELLIPPQSFFFFFNDTATTEIYPLPLHDAFPISADIQQCRHLLDWLLDRAVANQKQACLGTLLLHQIPGLQQNVDTFFVAQLRDANYGIGTLLGDRKSTRLNSSHTSISYAVFSFK